MQKITALLLATLLVHSAAAQNSFRAIVRDGKTLQPLTGASIGLENAAFYSEKNIQLQ